MSNKLKAFIPVIVLALLAGALWVHSKEHMVGAVSNGADVTTTNFTSLSSANGIGNGALYTTVSARTVLTTATTTPCAIQSPNATSTLVWADLQITTSSTTATTWTLAKATSAYATTTFLDSFSLGSGAQGTMFSRATTTGIDISQVLAPNTFVVWGLAGIGNLTSNKLLGSCVASFTIVP